MRDLEVLERAFARGRRTRVDATLHRETLARARVMMSSEQLKAFDVSQEPASVRAEYGDTPFGRGCLAARRLIEVGVRCVEVTLDGWDTHVNNHAFQSAKVKILDPAFAALLRDLKRRNAARSDRRPLLRRVRPHAQDQPDGRPRPLDERLQPGAGRRRPARRPGDRRDRPRRVKDPARPATVEDVHATVLAALGLDPAKENVAPATSRPIKLSQGKPIRETDRRLAVPELNAFAQPEDFPTARPSSPKDGAADHPCVMAGHGPAWSSPSLGCGSRHSRS